MCDCEIWQATEWVAYEGAPFGKALDLAGISGRMVGAVGGVPQEDAAPPVSGGPRVGGGMMRGRFFGEGALPPSEEKRDAVGGGAAAGADGCPVAALAAGAVSGRVVTVREMLCPSVE